ncbi:MAG: hypothetical protein AVDCRST_MAG89-3199, partial [uncultured Gemmatimonadetes bacterium]
ENRQSRPQRPHLFARPCHLGRRGDDHRGNGQPHHHPGGHPPGGGHLVVEPGRRGQSRGRRAGADRRHRRVGGGAGHHLQAHLVAGHCAHLRRARGAVAGRRVRAPQPAVRGDRDAGRRAHRRHAALPAGGVPHRADPRHRELQARRHGGDGRHRAALLVQLRAAPVRHPDAAAPRFQPAGDRPEPVHRGDRRAQPGAGLRLHRAGRRAGAAALHGVVRRLRAAGDAGVALPGDPAPPREAAQRRL